MKKTLFLFIPHFVFSSDLLNTNYIKYLSSKYRVIVFSPIFKNNPADSYYQSKDVEYIGLDLEYPNFWLSFTKTLRISLIREFDELRYFKLRKITKINLNWQRKLLRFLGWFLPRKFLTADFFTKLECWLLPNSKRFTEYIKKYNPSLALTCTPGFSPDETEAIVLSKKNNLKTVAINSSWDNFTSNSIQFRKTDYLICWNKVMKEEAEKIHNYLPDKVFVSGICRFDHHFEKNNDNNISREEFLLSKNLAPSLKTLLLCTVPPNTYPPQYKVWEDLLKLRGEKKISQDVNILIRLHPNDLIEKYDKFKNLKNVHIELAGKLKNKTSSSNHKIEMDESDLINLRLSLKYTDVNINFRSSLSLEATIYDKPIINIALHNFSNRYDVDWYIPIIQSGGVKLVTTTEELCSAINEYLENPDTDKLGRQKIFNDYITFSDGLSYKRNVDITEKIIQEITD